MKARPIAMNCTQEQFESIKPKLDKAGIRISNMSSFEKDPFLINNAFGYELCVCNFSSKNKKDRELFETWNERIFLEYCGVEVEAEKHNFPNMAIICEEKITLESYKKVLKLCFDNDVCISDLFIKKPLSDEYIYFGWDGERISRYSHNNDLKKMSFNDFKKFFTGSGEIFKEDKKELVVGKWYKSTFNALVFNDNGKLLGFVNSAWKDFIINTSELSKKALKHYSEATPQEIQQALENEARKRGFKEGVKFKNVCGTDSKICTLIGEKFIIGFLGRNNLHEKNSEGIIFENGIWAEIIQPKPMTQQQIEKELGYEISII